MFDLPEAKRVRREDLIDSEVEREGSGDKDGNFELISLLNDQIAKSLGLDLSEDTNRNIASSPPRQKPGKQDATAVPMSAEDDDAEFDFRLFSTSGPSTKVKLEADRPSQGGLARRRPISYYVATHLSPQERKRLQHSAVSGERILSNSGARAWSLELPWRVVRGSSLCQQNQLPAKASAVVGRRGRPGKRSRILLRRRAREGAEKARQEATKLAEKEKQLKEKKKRLNRAKKLRKRAKEKGKKGEDNDGSGAESDE